MVKVQGHCHMIHLGSIRHDLDNWQKEPIVSNGKTRRRKAKDVSSSQSSPAIVLLFSCCRSDLSVVLAVCAVVLVGSLLEDVKLEGRSKAFNLDNLVLDIQKHLPSDKRTSSLLGVAAEDDWVGFGSICVSLDHVV